MGSVEWTVIGTGFVILTESAVSGIGCCLAIWLNCATTSANCASVWRGWKGFSRASQSANRVAPLTPDRNPNLYLFAPAEERATPSSPPRPPAASTPPAGGSARKG